MRPAAVLPGVTSRWGMKRSSNCPSRLYNSSAFHSTHTSILSCYPASSGFGGANSQPASRPRFHPERAGPRLIVASSAKTSQHKCLDGLAGFWVGVKGDNYGSYWALGERSDLCE